MPIPEVLAWITIAVTALAVWVTRAGGFALMDRVSISPAVERFLERMSLSVIVAIVATAMTHDSLRTAAAVLAGAAAFTISRRPIVGMLAGVAIAAAWTNLVS